jgi:hypothetical protein
MVRAVFDHEGRLAKVIYEKLPSPQQLLDAGDSAAVYKHNHTGYLQRALRITPGMIRVRAFCLPEAELAVYELPESLQDFQENPGDASVAAEERERLQAFLHVWKDRGQFVLEWGNDYWLDKSGEVVAS